ncbi:MAG: hypothetical protein QOC93_857 [Actinomycetota bacterium]|jgi:hypothetical protein|nr:hypothetical protein [Actinomycetota bacterium]
MSLALFGTILLLILIGFCWGHSRTIAAAVVAVLLGMTIATSTPMAGVSRQLVGGIGNGLAYLTGTGRR